MALILDGSLGVPVTTVTGTLPVANGGTGVATSTGSGANALATSPTLTTPVLSGSVTGTYTLAGTPTMGASLITSGTAVATTSGTSIDFTSIPSWVKRLTLVFNGVSTNGTSDKRIQLGSGSIQTTGYVTAKAYATTAAGNGSSTAGFEFLTGGLAAETVSGNLVFSLVSGSIWVGSGLLGSVNGNQPGAFMTGGNVTLAGTLDRVRLTTVNGSDTFDAGSVNILYE